MYRNIKIVLQYDGTRYSGWQKLGNNQNTIQGRLENILERLAGEPVAVHGSGRTDAGVHALGQVANFHIDDNCLGDGRNQLSRQEAGEWMMKYLNRYLPEDIAIISADEVPERFHSRLNATEKTYVYQVDMAERKNVFERKYIYGIGKPLDVSAMREAAGILIGSHDFKAFCSLKRMKKSTVRELREIVIFEKGSHVKMEFTGTGFLYNMVRILAGTLIEVGLHSRTQESVREALLSCNRELAGFTAPAEGLFLKSVRYEG